jgi:transposase
MNMSQAESDRWDRILGNIVQREFGAKKLDCSQCLWRHPDACRSCRAEQREKAEWSVGYKVAKNE